MLLKNDIASDTECLKRIFGAGGYCLMREAKRIIRALGDVDDRYIEEQHLERKIERIYLIGNWQF